jgi:parallel beta-helix repeat protein
MRENLRSGLPSRVLTRYSLFALLGLACMGLKSAAADGKIPVYAVPLTISAPGYYYLTQDVSGGKITIAADHVTLDLNGHLLTSLGDAIDSSGSPSRIRITNGNISAAGKGIQLGLANGGFAQVDHVTILSGVGSALSISGPSTGVPASARVEHNIVTGVTTGHGIELTYMSGGHIEGNEVRGIAASSYNGIFLLYSHNNTLSDNTCTSNPGNGIGLSHSNGNQIERNNCSSNGQPGIYLSNANSNTLTWNTAAGIDNVPYYGIGFYNGSAHNVYAYNYTPGTSAGIFVGTDNTNGGGNF